MSHALYFCLLNNMLMNISLRISVQRYTIYEEVIYADWS